MTVSVIIPIYRRTEWIGRCLEALARQDFSDRFEVVVIDDGSPNCDEVRRAIDNSVETSSYSLRIFRKNNAGPAAARNFGVCQTGSAIVCFIDDDSVPHSNWLEEISRPIRESTAGLVSGKTCSYDRENPLPLLLERTVYAGKCFATCNIAYRRSVFDALGGFDENFPSASWEDNDLGLRARWAGYFHVYNDKAIVFHPHEASLDEYKEKCCLNGKGAAVFSCKYLRSRPLWGLGTPFVMSRRLLCGLNPKIWFARGINAPYVKFLWSFYSLKGFITAIRG